MAMQEFDEMCGQRLKDSVARKQIDEIKAKMLKYKPVTKLPTESIDENTIYLVPISDGTGSNKYTAHLYVNGEWEDFETLVEIDLNIENGAGVDSIVQVYTGNVDETHYGNTCTGDSGAVFGEANNNNANRALMAGKLGNNSGANAIMGGLWNTNTAQNADVTGSNNTNKAKNTVLSGEGNTLESGQDNIGAGAGNKFSTVKNSAFSGVNHKGYITSSNITGSGHDITATTSDISGKNNSGKVVSSSVTGESHVVDISYAIVGGYGNEVVSSNGIVVATHSYVGATGAAVFGAYHHIETGQDYAYPFMAGEGLKQSLNDYVRAKTTVGKFNAEVAGAQFIVGIGTSDTDRKNGLVVYEDGKIVAGDTIIAQCGEIAELRITHDTKTDNVVLSMPSDNLYVDGNIEVNGFARSLATETTELTVSGNATVEGTLNVRKGALKIERDDTVVLVKNLIISSDDDTATFNISTENDGKLSFDSPIEVLDVDEFTADSNAVNKKYVDEQIATISSALEECTNDVSSLKTDFTKYKQRLEDAESDIDTVKEQLVDIDAALDAILAIQNKLIGGGS